MKVRLTRAGYRSHYRLRKQVVEPVFGHRIDQGDLTHSEFGFINEAAKPPYRVF